MATLVRSYKPQERSKVYKAAIKAMAAAGHRGYDYMLLSVQCYDDGTAVVKYCKKADHILAFRRTLKTNKHIRLKQLSATFQMPDESL